MPTQYYSVSRLHYAVLATFLYLVFIFHTNLAFNLLHLNSEGELGWELLRDLSPEKVYLAAI